MYHRSIYIRSTVRFCTAAHLCITPHMMKRLSVRFSNNYMFVDEAYISQSAENQVPVEAAAAAAAAAAAVTKAAAAVTKAEAKAIPKAQTEAKAKAAAVTKKEAKAISKTIPKAQTETKAAAVTKAEAVENAKRMLVVNYSEVKHHNYSNDFFSLPCLNNIERKAYCYCFFNVSFHLTLQVMYCRNIKYESMEFADLANRFLNENRTCIAGQQNDIVGFTLWLLKLFDLPLFVKGGEFASISSDWDMLFGYNSHHVDPQSKSLTIVGAAGLHYEINNDKDLFCIDFGDKWNARNKLVTLRFTLYASSNLTL